MNMRSSDPLIQNCILAQQRTCLIWSSYLASYRYFVVGVASRHITCGRKKGVSREGPYLFRQTSVQENDHLQLHTRSASR